MLFHYLKIEFRSLIRQKYIGFLKISGIIIGFMVALIIGQFVYNELTYDAFQKDASNKYLVQEKKWFDREYFSRSIPYALTGFIKQSCPEVKDITLVNRKGDKGFIKSTEGYIDPNLDEFVFVDDNFFSFFSYQFIAGSPSEFTKVVSPAIISDRLANSYFGGANAIGKNVELLIKNKKYEFTVIGIIENPPAYSNFNFEWIGAMSYYQSNFGGQNFSSSWEEDCECYIHLNNEANIDHLTSKIASFYSKNANKEGDNKKELHLGNIQKLNLSDQVKTKLIVYSSLAILILLISLINFVLLVTTENFQKMSQRAIEKISGAGKKEVFFENISSSFIPIFIALVIAVFLTLISSPHLQQYFPNKFYNSTHIIAFLGIAFSLCFLATLFTGSLKTIILSQQAPVDLLKNKFSKGKTASFINNSLLTFQLISFIGLVSASLIMEKQLNFMQVSDVGFNKEFLISLKLSKEDQKAYSVFKKELLSNSGIVKVAGTDCPPYVNHRAIYGTVIRDENGNKSLEQTEYIFVDNDYLTTMQMELKYGEELLKNSKDFCIVNESFIKRQEIDNPLGENVELGGKKYIISGVLKDFNQHSFHEQINPFVVFKNAEKVKYALIRIYPGNIQKKISIIKDIAKSTLPNTPFDFHFMDDMVEKYYKDDVKNSRLVFILSVIAIAISLLGLVGLSYFNARKRIKEIGIRKVNGAKIYEVLVMLNKGYIVWVLVAFIIACPVSYYFMNIWLENFAYKTELSWWIFALAGFLALGIAILTVSWQSWRATSRNPVEALRYE